MTLPQTLTEPWDWGPVRKNEEARDHSKGPSLRDEMKWHITPRLKVVEDERLWMGRKMG